jgi:hypothetical protein
VTSSTGPVWVAFNEFGDYERTEPYVPDIKQREALIRLAKRYVEALANTFKDAG